MLRSTMPSFVPCAAKPSGWVLGYGWQWIDPATRRRSLWCAPVVGGNTIAPDQAKHPAGNPADASRR